jgi:hypothetical protein
MIRRYGRRRKQIGSSANAAISPSRRERADCTKKRGFTSTLFQGDRKETSFQTTCPFAVNAKTGNTENVELDAG